MSRILKAAYVNIENNVAIDNTFHLDNTKINHKLPEEPIVEDKQDKNIDLSKHMEEIENAKQQLIQEAKIEADAIIEEAKKQADLEAENIKMKAEEEANEKAEEIYKEAYEKAYEEGKKQAEADCENIKFQAQQLLEETEKQRQEAIDKFEPEIINCIIEATENILTSSFKINPEIISFLIKKGLNSVSEIKNLKIIVSDENYDFVEKNKDEIFETDTEKNNIQIVKDSSLKSTDCLIETEIGTIQCNVDDQLHSMKEALQYILN